MLDIAGKPVWVVFLARGERFAVKDIPAGRRIVVECGEKQEFRVDVIEHEYVEILRIELSDRLFCPACSKGEACEFWSGKPVLGFASRSPLNMGVQPPDFEGMFDGIADAIADFLKSYGPGPTGLTQAATVLGIAWPATEAEVLIAYKKKALEHHPDRNIGHEEVAQKKFIEICAAKELLVKEIQRRG